MSGPDGGADWPGAPGGTPPVSVRVGDDSPAAVGSVAGFGGGASSPSGLPGKPAMFLWLPLSGHDALRELRLDRPDFVALAWLLRNAHFLSVHGYLVCHLRRPDIDRPFFNRRSSDNPIAIACLREVTFGPVLLPLCNLPAPNSRMTPATSLGIKSKKNAPLPSGSEASKVVGSAPRESSRKIQLHVVRR